MTESRVSLGDGSKEGQVFSLPRSNGQHRRAKSAKETDNNFAPAQSIPYAPPLPTSPVIANDQGNRTTPSYVAFTSDERLIGDAAKNQAAMNPINTVFDAKRLIGRRFEDDEVKKDMKSWPFEVVDKDGAPVISVDYLGEKRQFTPAEISAMVLSKLKETAEAKVSMVYFS